jgi:small subunit ribosomal protein S27Ae
MSSKESPKKKPASAEPAKKPAAEEAKKKPVEEAKKKPTAEEAPKKPAAAEAPRKAAPTEAKKKKKKATRVSSYYKAAEGGVMQRKLRYCPRCGPGTFLAEHYDRISCGKCGYAEFRRKSASP